MEKKKFSIKTVLLIVLAIIWLGSLFFSTKIILLATGYNLTQTKDTLPNPSTEVKSYIDRVSAPEGLLKVVYYEGWAFHPDFKPDSKRHITVFLKSDGFVYELPTKTYSRTDVVNAFRKEYDSLTANDLGFIGSFSTIAIQDRVYEVVLKVWEENGSVWIKPTGKFFEKSGDNFAPVEKPKSLTPAGISEIRAPLPPIANAKRIQWSDFLSATKFF